MLNQMKTYISIMIIVLISFGCSAKQEKADLLRLNYNRDSVKAIDRELSNTKLDERDRAVFRGLRWCIVFCDEDENFNFTFANYLTMLDELTLHQPSGELASIVHNLILREFQRAQSRLPKLFSADASGYVDFISILPIAYHHQAPIGTLKEFAERQFANVTVPDRLAEFRKALRERNYDLLTTLVVDAAFKNMAYQWKADKDFRLPPDNYEVIMAQCSKIPFLRKYRDEAFHDQNYYATHVLLALNHYGQEKLKASLTSDEVFFYLVDQYKVVRNRIGDLDLLCEYLYCFRQFAPKGVQFITEGEKYVMSLQNQDGSWGTKEDFEGDPYDRLHPTWTAITLLVQRDKS